MKYVKRGCGSHRGIYICAIAVLGLALSGCGGNGSSASAAPGPASSAATQSSTAGSVPSQGSTTTTTTTTQGTAPAQGTSTGSTGSGTAPATPPTATAGNITLNWVPPTENVDSSPLTNLAGYDIHYGTASGQYTQTISISNPGIATYVVSNLSPGTYYFSVTAVNSQGTESPMSSEVSTTVN